MKKFIILIPYLMIGNQFQTIKKIDLQINNWDAEVSILIVNDASTEKRL